MTASRPSGPTALRAGRTWTVSAGGSSLDVEITARDHDLLADVLGPLGTALGRSVSGLWAGSARLSDDLPLSSAVLAHGAALQLDGPAASRRSETSALELRVVGGPDAGRALPLGRGRHVIGRGSDAGVRIDDPDLSRRHVAVDVANGTLTVADLGSTNGSRLGDRTLDDRPQNWPPGATLRAGGTALRVAGPDAPTASMEAAPGGRFRVRPTPRMTLPGTAIDIVFPGPPAPPPRRRLAWVGVALPAVGGVAMAWFLHTPTFLFFALLGPLIALGTWLSERWTGRRSGRRDVAAHAAEELVAEARLADAVAADVRATEAAIPDLAAIAAAARRRTSVLWSRAADDTDALTLRLGTGPGTTRVTRVPADGVRLPATTPDQPVAVDLRAGGGLAVVGPRERALGVVAALVAQLATLHAPDQVELLLLTEGDLLRDWQWARWLPHLPPSAVRLRPATGAPEDAEALNAELTRLIARRRATGTGRGTSPPEGRWLVVLVDRPLDARGTATLQAGRDSGVLVVSTAHTLEAGPVPVGAVLRLAGETGDEGVLCREGLPDRGEVHVDRLHRGTAARLARDLAALVPAASATSLPHRARLLDLPGTGLTLDALDRIHGSWSTARDGLVALLGRTTEGPLQVDLCRDGPHALIAGTTGSGKSELLQTLIAGLALRHPPDRCSFLLVDYKGGAAFAEAAALPHTVGLVTDLDGRDTARALRSLGAELTRREQILAAHGVVDVASLPEDVALARLVIVVDEFATLAEELPDFVPGLVGIAQRGRSLGVHLVLATQRPSGVVSPEIRANCTLRVCLRTTDEADSRDVLGTVDAAHLPVDLPGRAYLRSGSGAPVAVQVARVAGTADATPDCGPEARVQPWPMSLPPSLAPGGSERTDLTRICRAVTAHAELLARPLPHRPWLPPLPDRILTADVESLSPRPDGAPRVGPRLPIGLVDLPHAQARDLLEIDLAEGGTWLAVGGPRSGRTTLLRTVLSEAAHRFGPDELHVYAIEAGGAALVSDAERLPHAGTSIRGEDTFRAVRLVDRLGREVEARRAGTSADRLPLILLLVDGLEALGTLLDDADPARGSAALLRLLRDGAAVGLTCVATADRAVPGGRLAAVASRRLVLPLPDRADYAVAGIAARDVPEARTAGRALIGDTALECQLALPRALPTTHRPGEAFLPPIRIVELPADPAMPLPGPVAGAPRRDSGFLALPIGPGGDEGRPLVVDLLRTGGLLVTGPPGSGRSTAVDAFAAHLRALGSEVLRLGVPATTADGGSLWVDPLDEGAIRAWAASLSGRPGVVVADDVGAPGEWPALAALSTDRSRSGVALIAASSPGQLAAHYQGPVAGLRRARSGLLLCPGPGDADLLGVRLPRIPLPTRPGSGWLIAGTGLERVQVARRTPPAGSSGTRTVQSSSSTGPISCVAYQASSCPSA